MRKKTQVVDVNVNIKSKLIGVMYKIQKIFGAYSFNMDVPLMRLELAKVKKAMKDTKATVFQFEEIVPNSLGHMTYIYLDLSVSYLKYMSENLPDVFSLSSFQNLPKTNVDHRCVIQDQYLESCSGVFTMGKWLAKDLVERCGVPSTKVHHVGGGINLDKDKIDYSQKKGNKLLFVGRDFQRKGGHLVYAAFCQLRSLWPEVELYVAGPSVDPYPDHVNGYHYMGDCNKEQLALLFNKCDVFVMPSYFEAYGLVFIEALTYGLPCIGRDAFEMSNFIEDGITGRLVKNDDTRNLAMLMKELLNDETIKRNVRSRRDRYIKEYSWDTVVERILKTMDSGPSQNGD